MKLRTRLVLAVGLLVFALVAGFVGLVVDQRRYLEAQLDKQLNSIPAGAVSFGTSFPVSGPAEGAIPTPSQQRQFDAARSQSLLTDLALATLTDNGKVTFLVRPTDTSFGVPRLTASDISRITTSRRIVTVDSDREAPPFRVRLAGTRGGISIVVGMSTARIEQAQRRFVSTGLAGLLGLGALLTAIGVWINRLGLRPIRALTTVAEAQLNGERTRRVDHPAITTEAGQLGAGFNQMLDARERAEQHLRTFVSDASHELRTPLTSIRGYLDLDRRGAFASDAERADAMRRVRQESNRMAGLVDDLLLLAQLDQGRPLNQSEVNLTAILRDLAHDTMVSNPERTVGIDIADGLHVIGDADRLIQVFSNLTRNAVVHTPATAAVTITARRHHLPSERVLVDVSDNGPGMTPEHAAQVFDRFFRSDASRTRDRGGAGLGLSIARSIVEAHGGQLTVRTAPGTGSTFTVELPAKAATTPTR